MREEETGNPTATLSPVKISTILESNQPTSFLFCFKNCFSVSAEGLKRPTWYYRICSLSPYGVAVGFFYDTTSRITVVVEASKPRHSNESAIFRFLLLLLLFCFVFFLRKLNRFTVSFLVFLFCFVLFCFSCRFEANTCPPLIKLNWLLKAIVIAAVLLKLHCTLNKRKFLPWKILNGKVSADKSRESTRRFFNLFPGNIVKDKTQK